MSSLKQDKFLTAMSFPHPTLENCPSFTVGPSSSDSPFLKLEEGCSVEAAQAERQALPSYVTQGESSL